MHPCYKCTGNAKFLRQCEFLHHKALQNLSPKSRSIIHSAKNFIWIVAASHPNAGLHATSLQNLTNRTPYLPQQRHSDFLCVPNYNWNGGIYTCQCKTDKMRLIVTNGVFCWKLNANVKCYMSTATLNIALLRKKEVEETRKKLHP